jgi:hypothetical protein
MSESQPDWFVEHMEYFMYGSTIRFILIMIIWIVLTMVSISYIALMSYIGNIISLRVCLGICVFLLTQQLILAGVMGISKSCYDSVPHPKHEGYSAYACIMWFFKKKEKRVREVIHMVKCDACKTSSDSEKVVYECEHTICAECNKANTSCMLCVKP